MKICSKYIILFFLLLFVFSCKERQQEKRRPATITPRISESLGFLNPKTSITVAKQIPVDENKLKKNPAGKPLIIAINNNIHIAGASTIVIAGKPQIITPGTDTFLFPQKTLVADSPVVAKIPITFIAKDMTIKNPNSGYFSVFGKQHGLKHGIVSCLLEDKLGNLWFGTAGGVTKFDGVNFTNYTKKKGSFIMMSGVFSRTSWAISGLAH